MAFPFPAPPPNLTAISEATAKAYNYVIPSVDQIYEAGMTWDHLNQSLAIHGSNLSSIRPDSIFPVSFDDLWYNVSWLWPQLDITGPILTPEHCTPQTCSLLFAIFLYLPDIKANLVLAGVFGAALLFIVPLSLYQRTWGYLIGMGCGLLCETLGYVGRVLMAQDIFGGVGFYIYITCLTFGPAFISFSIYTCLARIVVVYGRHISRLKPRTYTYIFAVADFLSLALQGAGGGLSSSGSGGDNNTKIGRDLLIAGLIFQVVSLSTFIALCADFGIRVWRYKASIDGRFMRLGQSRRFKGFLWALSLATLTIYIRSVFRVIELWKGFHSKFANDEVTFLAFESSMIFVAVVALTAFHPTIVFGTQWKVVSRIINKPNEDTSEAMKGIELEENQNGSILMHDSQLEQLGRNY